MAQYTRFVRIESDEPIGQFLETQLETFIGGEEQDVRVDEIDAAVVPEDLL